MIIRLVGLRAMLPVLLCFLVFPLAAQQKYALVIGNGAYTSVTPLRNPVNDANDMKTVLETQGWKVDLVLNGNLSSMEEGVSRLQGNLSRSKDSYGLFFYAGHGVQSNGENYLIPVDANIASENYLKQKALSVQTMLEELNDARNELNVVILDACRDNPFSWKRSGSRGLQVVTQQPAGSIVVFATSAGSTSADGEGRNGLFTAQFLTNLRKPGLSVTDLFNQTGSDVARASGNKQFPEMHSKYYGIAYLGSKPTPVAVQPAPTPAPAPKPAAVSVPANFVRIPGGTFMMGSPSSEVDRSNGEVQHQVTVSSFYMSKYEVTQKEWTEVMGTTVRQIATSNGWSLYGEGDNYPMYDVSWYDVIEYCNKRSVKEGLTPAYTINKGVWDNNNTNSNDNVHWQVTWNRQANGYRLPTEAEWEYACRAGSSTPFSTGNNITTNQANYNGNNPYNNGPKGAYREKTWAVGSGVPNGFGLYDMHGNVWEWCWDWYGAYATGAQTDPMGAVSGAYRVWRGGSWDGIGRSLRSAFRSNGTPTGGDYGLGIRLVRP